MMRDYRDAIRRSFRYLEEDSESLIEPMSFITIDKFSYANNPPHLRSLVYGIDTFFKNNGYLLSKHDKEALKKGGEHIIGRHTVVSIENGYTFIAPYESQVVMDKGFREECRNLKVGTKLRCYLYGAPEAWSIMRQLKGDPTPLQSD